MIHIKLCGSSFVFLHSPHETERRERGRPARNEERKTSEKPNLFHNLSHPWEVRRPVAPWCLESVRRAGGKRMERGWKPHPPPWEVRHPAAPPRKGSARRAGGGRSWVLLEFPMAGFAAADTHEARLLFQHADKVVDSSPRQSRGLRNPGNADEWILLHQFGNGPRLGGQ